MRYLLKSELYGSYSHFSIREGEQHRLNENFTKQTFSLRINATEAVCEVIRIIKGGK